MADEDQCYTPLGTYQITGLSFIVESGLLSLCAILCVFALVLRNVIITRRSPFYTHVDVYIASLFICDTSQALGAIFDLRWILLQKVQCGSHCAAQGALQQWGETGVAMSTIAIAVHTFCGLFFRWSPPSSKLMPTMVVVSIWAFNLIFVVAGYVSHPKMYRGGGHPFYVATPYWCWIRSSSSYRIFGEYFWMWAAIITSVLLYTPLFLLLRRKIVITEVGSKWYHTRIMFNSAVAADSNTFDVITGANHRRAKEMLAYPIAYSLTVLPLTIFRWFSKTDHELPIQDQPFALVGIAGVIFGLSGVVNVIVFVVTRPGLLQLRRQAPCTSVYTQRGSQVYPGTSTNLSGSTRSSNISLPLPPKAAGSPYSKHKTSKTRDSMGEALLSHTRLSSGYTDQPVEMDMGDSRNSLKLTNEMHHLIPSNITYTPFLRFPHVP
ncbi:hypothetical protein BOTBODRAFT_147219 [Botryobasidium botryosum FD-172 SS1]|uniref:Uncharacterized protein n=1 Tax=Botryobasidium botryosum (strain FD-172 SS1) TaxID=930990 RepID=A0A067M6Y1_BOTB1|nr:hypothetical protein BOTBODRAFT_147219 [Botryobasidium botryosum FD-172 SS1]